MQSISQSHLIASEKELGHIADIIAPLLRVGDVLTLVGDLGAGKTALARALITQLAGHSEEVPSPTFTLVQTYDLPKFSLWHFDLYRLEEEERDILELGWEEARRFGVSLVEWPERLGGLLPQDRLEIKIEQQPDSENSRRIIFTPFGHWQIRMANP